MDVWTSDTPPAVQLHKSMCEPSIFVLDLYCGIVAKAVSK